MSKELPSNKNNNEEVDLVVFFNLIGNAFSKLFDFIASIFRGLFNILIIILSHFYKRGIWYAGALVLGLAIGIYLDKTSDKRYGANMFIETNYNSSYQVYENMRNLNELANVDNDTQELEKVLGLDKSEASSLKGFYISPNINPMNTKQIYLDFIEGLDSLSAANTVYEDFISSISHYNYSTHQIGVISTDKNIYTKLNKILPTVLSENPYLNKLKEVGQENYRREEQTLTTQKHKIDSLVRVYLQIRADQSNKPSTPGTGTNLYMGDSQKNELLVNEAELLEGILEIEEKRREVIGNMAKEENIISVVSDFPSSGYDMREWYESRKVLMPLLSMGLLLLIFLFIGLGKYLKTYKQPN